VIGTKDVNPTTHGFRLSRASLGTLTSVEAWNPAVVGFFFWVAERRYRRLGPATLHDPVLTSEHVKETGCAKLQYEGAGACWP